MMRMSYFKLFTDYKQHIQWLSDEEKGQLFTALFSYADEEEIPPLSPAAHMAFSFITAQIERDWMEYQSKCETSRQNGAKGGRPKKPEGMKENPENPTVFLETQKRQDKEKDKDKDKEEDKEKDKDILPPKSPKGDADTEQGENVTVQIARGSGKKKPVDHSKTLAQELFASFWEKYPRKVDRSIAEKAWMKICPDKELFDRIMDALCTAIYSDQWRSGNGQYIPYPATWLNRKRWESESTIQLPEAPSKKRTYDLEAYEDMDFLSEFARNQGE